MGSSMYECRHGTAICVETRSSDPHERYQEFQCQACFIESIISELDSKKKGYIKRIRAFCEEYLTTLDKEDDDDDEDGAE